MAWWEDSINIQISLIWDNLVVDEKELQMGIYFEGEEWVDDLWDKQQFEKHEANKREVRRHHEVRWDLFQQNGDDVFQ